MIICPNCQYKEISGALFCSQCGAQFIASVDADLLKAQLTRNNPAVHPGTDPKFAAPAAAPGAWISLHIVESGQILPLAERREFSLGRVSEGQPIMPDIDLTPYNAFDSGVSRLHAVLKKTKNKIVIMDLGSSNGTCVNGIRLAPQVEHVLAHGDTIHLGKLKLQILFSQDEK